ncbi:uncharacterized protein PHALS_02773 [Plasmopara halstedii]|uniref:Uncharacterized protein n=1 Tax=Plasmopara halstedii TaxID=4781 RepID=A0A0P1AXY9_PLAHL|nr:uncharacterized protein PHALS_02773 [Plasmopara halstedii]CEG46370.1 hypothetical protein PHALS_02773 [Plasmopara halstedii]|eukprot:XP_024582739.1 hypothetical protein PHALS_02773 [Plasmopara halstedii]
MVLSTVPLPHGVYTEKGVKCLESFNQSLHGLPSPVRYVCHEQRARNNAKAHPSALTRIVASRTSHRLTGSHKLLSHGVCMTMGNQSTE